MSRSGYSEDIDDNWQMIIWRGAVASAIRGRRGQAFLREMLAAMDALPTPRLIEGDLEAGGDVCALGAIGKARCLDMSEIDPEDSNTVASTFGIAAALAREIVFINDEGTYATETPERRFQRVRDWVVGQIKDQPSNMDGGQ